MNLDQPNAVERYNSYFPHFIPCSPFKKDQNTFLLRDGHKIRKRGKKNNGVIPKCIITQVELFTTKRCSTSPDAPKPRRFSTSINENSTFLKSEEFELPRTLTGGASLSSSIRKDSFMERGEDLEPMCKSLFRQETQTTQSENPEILERQDKNGWKQNEEKINDKMRKQKLRREQTNKKQCTVPINKIDLNCEPHKSTIEIGTHTIHYMKNLNAQPFKAPYAEKLNEIRMKITVPNFHQFSHSRPHTSANISYKRRQLDKNKTKLETKGLGSIDKKIHK